MPELPEVETSRRGIEPHLVGQRITRLVVRQPRLRWPVPQTLLTLTDKLIISVQRRAKYLLLELDQGGIIIHLGMSGSVRILPGSTAAQKHDHIDMLLTNDLILRYTDPRRFGAWLWCEDIHHAHLLAHLGPEPLSEDFNQHYLYQYSRHKKTPIKSWLMDNKIVVGIGNIYANESLFTARIHPNTPANTLTKAQAKLLTHAIKTVLLQAIAKGGTTLKDFLQSDGKPGYFAQELHVYGRAGQPCRVCGSIIVRHPQKQRATFFCPQCQRHTPSR